MGAVSAASAAGRSVRQVGSRVAKAATIVREDGPRALA
ncbi:MAG: hypothetical protein JWM93_283, partial [Frankiales bacterium]|nr:hypothetical protein [Frankiales bacterium]